MFRQFPKPPSPQPINSLVDHSKKIFYSFFLLGNIGGKETSYNSWKSFTLKSYKWNGKDL